MAPDSLEEALALRAERGDEATVLAGGTFLGILMNQGFLTPVRAPVARRASRSSSGIEVVDGELRLGAMVTHRAVEREAARRLAGARARVRRSSPARACATRRRSAACWRTPTTRPTRRRCCRARRPRACCARRAATARSRRGADPRLLRDLHRARRAARRGPGAAAAGAGDVPQVPLALDRGPAVRGGRRGARRRGCAWSSAPWPRRRRTSRTCAAATAGTSSRRDRRRYAERIEPLADARGSAEYRRRVIAAEVRRAVRSSRH